MSGNVANPTNDNTDRQYHRKRREMIEGNLKTTGTTTFSIAVFTDAKIKEQDEKQKEKILMILKLQSFYTRNYKLAMARFPISECL